MSSIRLAPRAPCMASESSADSGMAMDPATIGWTCIGIFRSSLADSVDSAAIDGSGGD